MWFYPERAEKRRNSVLNLMVRHGYITKEERDIAESIPVESLLNRNNKEANVYQGFIDLVCEEVKNRWGVDPYSVPMLIYTTMDRKVQDGINDIMNGKTYKWKDSVIQGAVTVLNSKNGQIKAIGAGRNRNGAKSYNYATFDKHTISTNPFKFIWEMRTTNRSDDGSEPDWANVVWEEMPYYYHVANAGYFYYRLRIATRKIH